MDKDKMSTDSIFDTFMNRLNQPHQEDRHMVPGVGKMMLPVSAKHVSHTTTTVSDGGDRKVDAKNSFTTVLEDPFSAESIMLSMSG